MDKNTRPRRCSIRITRPKPMEPEEFRPEQVFGGDRKPTGRVDVQCRVIQPRVTSRYSGLDS